VERRDVLRVAVIRIDNDPIGSSRHDHVHVEILREWSHAVASLVKISEEYRDGGLLVTNVGPNSPAAIAGVARGDVLLRYDGVHLDNVETLKRLTSRPIQDGGTRKQTTLEAVRSAQELTFTVPEGRLGITVSPLLHSFSRSRRRTRRRGWQGQEVPKPAELGFVKVPGELVPSVLHLRRIIERPGTSKQTKRVKALLQTAAEMG